MPNLILFLLILTSIAASAATSPESRPLKLRELATLQGARDNQLLGYGLVVGLNGTGDKRQTFFSSQSLANMLDRMGVQVNPQSMLVRNVAAVMVTGILPPYAQPGSKIDVTVAAIGDAQNLQGGILLQTSLRGANGKTYAVGQGPVVTGGFVAGGRANQLVTNHPTVGRVLNGALVEAEAPSIPPGAELKIQLNRADFQTAVRIAETINQKFGSTSDTGPVATAKNAGLILVKPPDNFKSNEVGFYAQIEDLDIQVTRAPKIVINERTGTILVGKDVVIRPIALMHGALSIEVSTSYVTSQPNPLSQGKTTVTPQVGVAVKEEKAKSLSLGAGASVDDLVQALKQLGATARDIIAIFQALKSAGALEAEVEVL